MKKIIIIEDEETLLNLLQKRLEQEKKYEVEIARDGEEGLRKIKNNKPDLILMDMIMPKKGGFEIMEDLNQDPEYREIPIIVISNSGQRVELSRIKELGAVDWVIKVNVDPEEVLNKVKKYLKT